jgi:1-acyl-sn-glycerol-3-phosphate acyltransferase
MKDEAGTDIPVVPFSIFGTQRAWGIPGKVRVNIGPPLYIRDYVRGDKDETVERFRAALQAAVEKLLVESIHN